MELFQSGSQNLEDEVPGTWIRNKKREEEEEEEDSHLFVPLVVRCQSNTEKDIRVLNVPTSHLK